MTKWYEKTVEYSFVRKFLKHDAMALDGNAETIGDAMFQNNGNKFYIVEFKRGTNLKSERQSEQQKYSNSSKSSSQLEKATGHRAHHIVFGKLEEENNKLQLHSINYIDFLRSDAQSYGELDSELLNNTKPLKSIDKEALKDYLQILINEKETSQGNSSLIDHIYSSTIIIDADGCACALSEKDVLTEHLNLQYNKAQDQKNKPEHTYSPPRPKW